MTMATYHFYTPLVMRASRASDGSFKDEGFFLCVDGAIVINKENKSMTIIDEDNEDEEKLTIFLETVDQVKCRRFHSAGGNFSGGKVSIQGTFDRMVEEQITIKMPTSTYEAVVEALRQVMG